MREYTGPTGYVHQVTFVPGRPPRLAAAARSAVYIWEFGRPEPVHFESGLATDRPRLAPSTDGRWLAAYLGDRQWCWDLSAVPAGPPLELAIPGVLAGRLTGAISLLTAVCR